MLHAKERTNEPASVSDRPSVIFNLLTCLALSSYDDQEKQKTMGITGQASDLFSRSLNHVLDSTELKSSINQAILGLYLLGGSIFLIACCQLVHTFIALHSWLGLGQQASYKSFVGADTSGQASGEGKSGVRGAGNTSDGIRALMLC